MPRLNVQVGVELNCNEAWSCFTAVRLLTARIQWRSVYRYIERAVGDNEGLCCCDLIIVFYFSMMWLTAVLCKRMDQRLVERKENPVACWLKSHIFHSITANMWCVSQLDFNRYPGWQQEVVFTAPNQRAMWALQQTLVHSCNICSCLMVFSNQQLTSTTPMR